MIILISIYTHADLKLYAYTASHNLNMPLHSCYLRVCIIRDLFQNRLQNITSVHSQVQYLPELKHKCKVLFDFSSILKNKNNKKKLIECPSFAIALSHAHTTTQPKIKHLCNPVRICILTVNNVALSIKHGG